MTSDHGFLIEPTVTYDSDRWDGSKKKKKGGEMELDKYLFIWHVILLTLYVAVIWYRKFVIYFF